MNISLDWYKIFYMVAKKQNITEASRKLFISQPAVSSTIKQLEKELKIKLFIRNQKGVKLTKEGEVLFEYVSSGIDKIETGEKKLLEQINLENGEIRIGSSDMCLQYFLLPYLEKFKEKYPKIKISITNGPTPETIELLKKDKIDFGLVSNPIYSNEGFKVIPVSKIEDIFICGEKYKKLADKSISLKNLQDYPFICLEENTSSREYINKYFGENGISFLPKYELATSNLIVDFAKRNFGIGCVVSKFAEEDIKNKKVYRINVKEKIKSRNICIIKKKNLISKASDELLKMMEHK